MNLFGIRLDPSNRISSCSRLVINCVFWMFLTLMLTISFNALTIKNSCIADTTTKEKKGFRRSQDSIVTNDICWFCWCTRFYVILRPVYNFGVFFIQWSLGEVVVYLDGDTKGVPFGQIISWKNTKSWKKLLDRAWNRCVGNITTFFIF